MLKIIKTDREYETALERAYVLMQLEAAETSDEYNELEILSLLIEHYEEDIYPITPPTPIEAIRFRLEQLGKDTSELSHLFGARSRQSEILSGKRKLSLSMIRKLHYELQIPAESLIAPY